MPKAPRPAKARAPRRAPAANPSRYFPALRRACLALPDAEEDYPWGDVVWKVRGKMFAACGVQKPLRVTVKPDPATALALAADPAVAPASYVGRFGWITVTVTDARTRALAHALVAESHALVSRGRTRPAGGKRR